MLTETRDRVRYWLQAFASLEKTLDRLARRSDSPMSEALAFLVNRALDQLEISSADEPLYATNLTDEVEPAAVGRRMVQTLEFARANSLEADYPTQEFGVLLLLAEAIAEEPGDGLFDDPRLSSEDLIREFRLLRHVSAETVGGNRLLPKKVSMRISKLLQHAETMGDAMGRLNFEMSLLRVVRSLYAIAIGLRNGSVGDGETRYLVAHSLGDLELNGQSARAGESI